MSTGHDDDSGLGLIELIVGILVSSLVLVGIASVLINSWLAQSDVLSTSEATNKGQLISSSIERAVRNALYLEVQAGGTELWVHTSLSGDQTCQAFRLDDGVASMKMSASGLLAEDWGAWINSDTDRGWTAMVRQVHGADFIEDDGKAVTYTFDIETDSAPVLFRGEVSKRSQGTWGSSPCW